MLSLPQNGTNKSVTGLDFCFAFIFDSRNNIKVFKVHIRGPGIEVKLFIDIVISFPCTWY